MEDFLFGFYRILMTNESGAWYYTCFDVGDQKSFTCPHPGERKSFNGWQPIIFL
jgi:hypothetical protein